MVYRAYCNYFILCNALSRGQLKTLKGVIGAGLKPLTVLVPAFFICSGYGMLFNKRTTW
jgi:hypothetical protein